MNPLPTLLKARGLAAFAFAFSLLPVLPAMAGWKNNEPANTIIGLGKLPSASTFYSPSGIAVSPLTGKVFVVDGGQHRVLRFSSSAAMGNGQAAEAVLGQDDFESAEFGTSAVRLNSPSKAVVDASGNLWLVDSSNNRVLRWANADTVPSGSPASQVLGHPDFTTRSSAHGAASLFQPSSLALDPAGRLWVADRYNHRILRYDNPAAKGNGGAADGVVGQPDFLSNTPGSAANQVRNVFDITVDGEGRLWVADVDNVRILRFDQPASQNQPSAGGVLGQPDFVSTATGSGPAQGNKFFHLATMGDKLFAFDSQNYRIVRWDGAASKPNGAPADGVLGRSSLASGAGFPGTGGSISECGDIEVEPSGRLWAVQWRLERVLRWDNVIAKAPMADADGVIGEPSITTTNPTRFNPAAQPWQPRAGLEDPVTGKFFLADSGRVLRFASRAAAEAGTAPEAFLGKPDPGQYGSGTASATNLRSGWGLALDSSGNLWVSDPSAHRVAAFAHAATAPSGIAMTVVLGQASFTASTSGLAADRLNTPRALALDSAGNLYVADAGNHRVLRFDNVASKATGAAADSVIGQADFLSASTASDAALLRNPSGLCLDGMGRLWVADTDHHRVVRYNAPLTLNPGAGPSGTLGQNGGMAPTSMHRPHSVAVSGSGRLWVLDTGYQRVLRFEDAASKPDAAAADGVIGAASPSDYTAFGRTRNRFHSPECLFLDAAENLWASDPNNNRTLKFLPVSSARILQTGPNASQKFEFTFEALDSGSYLIRSSPNLRDWILETTYQLTAGEIRTFTDSQTGPARFFRIEEP